MTRNKSAALLLSPILLFVALAYVVPFLGVVEWSFTIPEVGVANYVSAITDPLVVSVFVRTARLCILATLLAVTGAYAIAYLWVRGSALQRFLVELCILIPFWISVLTRSFGWVAVLSNRGLLNVWMMQLGFITEPLTLVRNEIGVLVGMVHYLLPFAVFPIASSMRSLDERVFLAARGMAASRTRIFWQVFLPMTFPGLLGAAILALVFSIGFFITPAILGGGRSVMAAELIYVRIFQSPDWGLAAAISVIMIVIVSLLLALMMKVARPGTLVK